MQMTQFLLGLLHLLLGLAVAALCKLAAAAVVLALVRGCKDQFNSEKVECAFAEYDLFRLVGQPGKLLTEF
jgi:hypothetical protein